MKENKFKNLMEIFWVATKLGLTSFGGPQAHLGYFHEEYVKKRKWLDEKNYADYWRSLSFCLDLLVHKWESVLAPPVVGSLVG